MLRIRSLALALAGGFVSVITTHAQFADSVAAFGGLSGYGTPASALGAPTVFIGYQNTDPFDPPYDPAHIVGLDTGGFLTLHLDRPIQNDPHPFGMDFIIFGHAGFNITNGDYSGGGITDGSFFTGGTATSRVSVSADGITFYTLDPSHAPAVDALFPTDAAGDPLLPVNPALTQADFAGKGLSGIAALYAGSAGGTGYDLSWAQDGLGHSVALSSVNYVRVDALSGPAYLDAISVVPEPGCAGLFLLAGVAWTWSKARIRKG